MLKEYTKIPSVKEEVDSPKKTVLNAILNYSKSLEVKTINEKRIILNLN